ncbi:MAG: helix-turn-helix domain-containing protein [Roseburia faecis]
MLAKRDFHLQTGNLGYKTGLSFTNGESWVTNGILGLLFTKDDGAMGKREHIYEIIAENIRKERRRLGITQAELAERADVSLDTIKSVENGRRAMSLDTYLNIVHALESSPMVLMSQQHPENTLSVLHL